MSDETQAVLDRVRAKCRDLVWGATLNGNDCADIQALLATVDALREDARRMRERFRAYGQHTETCDSWSGISTDPSGCSCGFTASWYAAFPEDRPTPTPTPEGR